MSRFSSILAVVVALSIMAPASAALAIQEYTINTEPLPLRASPSERAKAVIVLPPSSTVERVNDRSYTHVTYRTPEGKVKEGWILSKFLSPVPPDSSNLSKLQELSAENEGLKAQLTQLQNDGSGLSQKEKELTDKLSALNASYEELKSGSANYLKLKADYESAKTGLDNTRKTMQTLTRENEDLKLYHNIQWFLAGGLVLLFGWFLGWGSTRWRRKRKHSYYL